MTNPRSANKLLGMNKSWEVRYLLHVAQVTGRTLSNIAAGAKLSPTTLTRPVNSDEHKYDVKLSTLEAVKRETGIDFLPFKNGEEAKVEYVAKDGKLYLVHSEVPYNLRGRGIGKELVLKTFKKLTEEGHKAVAVCSYIKAVKNRDPKWKDIIE